MFPGSHPPSVRAPLAVCVAVVLSLVLGAAPQERQRGGIDDKYTWKLSDIYPSEEQWRQAKAALKAQIPEIRSFRGSLGQSAARLAEALDMVTALNKELARAAAYATMLSDEDTRVSKHQGMRQEMIQIASRLGADAAYIEPEILKIERPTIERFVSEEPRLRKYALYLDGIQRRRAHTKTDAEEKLLASAAPITSAPASIYGVFADADFPYPSVTLSSGTTVRLDPSGFSAARAVPNRDDRQKVMAAFFGALGKYRATFGSTFNSQVQADVFLARARDYPSALDAALDGPNIPVSVYSRLVDGVNKHLPTFHRYLALRKKMMGVSELHYYDLYAPLVASVDTSYTPEQAQKHVLAALQPLGPEYAGVVSRAFAERWIDLLPSEGKRSGAYSHGGAYDVHPFILMNYNGKYTDVSTLAHELGHTMHSYLSNRQQPFATASYPIFVAEVASTFNEALLLDYMLKNIKDDAARLSLLGEYLEGIKGTVFRQTQFAEFELKAHEMAEKRQPLTGEALDGLYADITRKYYGHDAGIAVVDDYVAHEWAFIPHFYRAFYVFQYATSFTASSALAEKVMTGDPDATRRYLAFLSAGGSKYPIDLLKDAGVDMTSDEPLTLTMRKMNRVMDEMEKLLAGRSTASR
jgi:oligoendopeptidase F